MMMKGTRNRVEALEKAAGALVRPVFLVVQEGTPEEVQRAIDVEWAKRLTEGANPAARRIVVEFQKADDRKL